MLQLRLSMVKEIKKKKKRQPSFHGYNHAVRETGWVSQNTSLDACEQSLLIRKGQEDADGGREGGVDTTLDHM